MADVFISYSRRDSDFVRRLHDALAARSRDVWVDWEDIPLSADWWREIRENIEAADTFVFVISPDSVTSKVCREEIDYAADNNKRIIPLLRRDISAIQRDNPDAIHPAISTYNWVRITEDSDFEQGVENLLRTLDTDLDYVRQHTRLLVRAKEWEARNRDAAILLNGAGIAEFRAWLAHSADKQPAPTDLQRAFLLASEVAFNRRQRLALLIVLVATLVTFGLVTTALVQSQRTIQAESTSVAIRATSEQQLLFLTQAQATSEAIRLQVTLQQATNEARQTAIRQEQDDRIREVQATLTQQAVIRGTETAIFNTLDAVQRQQDVIDQSATQIAATRRALEVIATLFALPTPSLPPTTDLTQLASELGTRIADDLFDAATRRAQESVDSFLAQTGTAQALGGGEITPLPALPPTTTPTNTPLPTATETPSPTPTATETPSPIPSPTETASPLTTGDEETPEAIVGQWFVAMDGSDANLCNHPERPCASISAALALAAPADTVNLAQGLYFETVTLTQDVILQGTDPLLTILSGENRGTTLTIAPGVKARVVGLNISGGKTGARGGGVLNQGTLWLEDSIVSGNTADGAGGGIANLGALVLDGTNVSNNYARWSGGVYNAYGARFVALRGGTVTDNTAAVSIGNDTYDDVCSDATKALLRQADTACSGLEDGQVCYLAPDVALVPQAGQEVAWEVGRRASIGAVERLVFQTAGEGAGAQGAVVARLRVSADFAAPNEPLNVLVRGGEAIPRAERLRPGGQALVNTAFGSPLNLRTDPSLRASVVLGLLTGQVVTLLDGPQRADGVTWWQARLASGAQGWSAERVGDIQTLLPIEAGQVGIGGRYWAIPLTGRGINLRANPGLRGRVLGIVERGREVVILDGPQDADGTRWWRVYAPYLVTEGWMAEQVDGQRALIPADGVGPLGIAQAFYEAADVCLPYSLTTSSFVPVLRSADGQLSLRLLSEDLTPTR
ncbi:MAG: TIR domain-containing protein [Anaerolineae bacterium]|nr:TIR domain-containing protein [Anaerolineae bacterium]MDW8171888.1 TIR domain-containing protein [Anaerolineae bacterium]